MAATGAAAAEDDGELSDWADWCPEQQTALDVLEAAERASAERGGAAAAAGPGGEATEGRGGGEDSEDDWAPRIQGAAGAEAADGRGEEEGSDDDWAPQVQGAAGAKAAEADKEALEKLLRPSHTTEAEGKGEAEEEGSDDDWAPQVQGAAGGKTAESDKEALEKLLRPSHTTEVKQEARGYETTKDADAAGRMLLELKRPPTVEEAKAEVLCGPSVDVDRMPEPLYRDITEEEAVEMVQKGATVACQDQHGRSPLHKACECAYPFLVRAICDAKGDPDMRDNYGETPLLMMAQSGQRHESVAQARRSECIQAMLSCGADVHAVNPRGRGVLHLACMENDYLAAETLIEGMAELDQQDLAGFTPLMWAAGRGGTSTVKMLLDYEADMNIKAVRGQTAISFALTSSYNAVVDILERHKALLDAEEAKRIAEGGGAAAHDEDVDPEPPLPLPAWACQKPRPGRLVPYGAGRIYREAKPDPRSNVYAAT